MDADGDGFTEDEDCDDANAAINPGATEVCDDGDVDEDCNGSADDADSGVDASTQTTVYADRDSDGYGDIDDAGALYCDPPSGTVTDNTDCNDDAAYAYPGATELCNDEDDDCDGSSDDGGLATFWDTVGAATDYTSAMTGTASSPAAVTLSEAGTLGICDGTWYVNLRAEASVDVYGQSGRASATVLDGGEADPVLQMYTDTIDVTLTDLTVQNGVGNNNLIGGTDTTGGGVNCLSASGDASVSLDNVVLDGNTSTYAGGGLFAYDCDVTITDSEVTDNESALGGGIMVGGGVVTITDTAIEDNYATRDFGGLYLYEASGNALSLTMTDSTLTDNEAYNAGSALAVWGVTNTISATVTGTTSGAMAITSNVEGGDGGAVFVSGTAEVTFTNVDFGTTTNGDDIDPYDIYGNAYGFQYWYDDGETFSCDSEMCGTETTETLGSAYYYDAFPTTGTRGNIFEAEAQGTIDTVEFYLGAGDSAGCDVDYFILSSTDTGWTWTVEWIESMTLTSTTRAMVSSSPIGLPVQIGTYYAVGFGFDCSANDTFLYLYSDVSGSSTSDVGMGTTVYIWETWESYDGYGSAGDTVPAAVVSSSLRYYSNINWSH